MLRRVRARRRKVFAPSDAKLRRLRLPAVCLRFSSDQGGLALETNSHPPIAATACSLPGVYPELCLVLHQQLESLIF